MQNDSQYMLTVDELSRVIGRKPKEVLATFDDTGLTLRSSIKPGVVKQYLNKNGMEYTPKVVAHINLKGGTGKTTSAISLASASFAFDQVPDEDDPIFIDVWQNPGDMVMGAIREISEFLYILPSSLDNGMLDMQLINPAAQKNAVKGVCSELLNNGFDLIVIDCPPSLGTAIISTICAADIIVTPLNHDAFSKKGLDLTIAEVQSICDTFNLESPEIKLLFTKFDGRIKMAKQSFDQLLTKYPEAMVPFPIRTCSELSKTLDSHKTIFASTHKNNARDDYDAYVKQLLGLDQTFSQPVEE